MLVVFEEPRVEMVDGVEFETLGLVTSQQPDRSTLGEEMFGVGDGGAEGSAEGGEYLHAISDVLGGGGGLGEFLGEPIVDCG